MVTALQVTCYFSTPPNSNVSDSYHILMIKLIVKTRSLKDILMTSSK